MKKNYWEINDVSGMELMAMRMMRGKTYSQMVGLQRKHKGILVHPFSGKDLEMIERDWKECPRDLVEFYMTVLGITNAHMAQFKKILKGQLKTFEQGRTITTAVKKEVKRKHNNKCAHCGAKTKLHFHHMERFAKGGQNTADNLVLLCASCHAEEHKGEQGYHMLKKLAEE